MCKTLQIRSSEAALAYQISIRIHINTRVVIITLETRSTGKVHTSAKARLNSVAISVPPFGESVRDDESGSGSPPKLVYYPSFIHHKGRSTNETNKQAEKKRKLN